MLNMSQLCDHEERGTLVTMSPYCLGANFSALSMEVEPTVMGLILAISSGLIIFTNLLVAAVLLRLLLKKSSQSWCFVLNLALADILVGVAITGLAAEDLSSNKYLLQKLGTATPANNATAHDQGKGRCLLRMGFVMSSCTASVLSLFLISIDRYVAIKMPLHYFKFSRNWKAAGLLLSLWISSFVLGFLPGGKGKKICKQIASCKIIVFRRQILFQACCLSVWSLYVDSLWILQLPSPVQKHVCEVK